MEVICSSETLVLKGPTQCHIPEDSILSELDLMMMTCVTIGNSDINKNK
jgi:hypothetical protein